MKDTIMPTLNVEQYSKSVINDAVNGEGAEYVARAVNAHSAKTAEEGCAHVGAAAKIRNTAIKQYSELRHKGVEHEQARDRAAKAVTSRFDDRGRDTQRHERQRSNAMSL